jgi:hypothetical protein
MTQSSGALPHLGTTPPLIKVDFKNKVLASSGRKLGLQELPQPASDHVDFVTEKIWVLRKLRNNCSS